MSNLFSATRQHNFTITCTFDEGDDNYGNPVVKDRLSTTSINRAEVLVEWLELNYEPDFRVTADLGNGTYRVTFADGAKANVRVGR